MKMRFVTLGLVLLMQILMGCNKPLPNPEVSDPIYQEVQKQLDEVRRALDAETVVYKEHEKELEGVIPQTGQIKYAEKRYWESKSKVDRLRQLVFYYETRLGNRKRIVRREYSIAFASEKPWPDLAEAEKYKTVSRMTQARRQWDLDGRFQKAGLQRRAPAKTNVNR